MNYTSVKALDMMASPPGLLKLLVNLYECIYLFFSFAGSHNMYDTVKFYVRYFVLFAFK